uniref:Mitochondrial ATPase n=1 Tax=Spirometra erinaceieuropaei TaxID=99802 RepID=A0A0F6MV65_SPIER|nr:mitochondrial ATPase [Spirometra erinaceieuropaei]
MIRSVVFARILSQSSLCAVAKANVAALNAADPIQRAFVEKLREYQQKAKTANLGLVDANETQIKNLRDTMDKLDHIFNAKGVDMTQFPSFSFDEPVLTNPGSNIVVEYPKPEPFEQSEADERIDGPLTKGPIVI